MDASLEESSTWARALLSPAFAGRRFVLIGGPVAGLASFVPELRSLGAERPFLLGSFWGMGSRPEPQEAECFSLDLSAPDLREEFRLYESRLQDLPEEATAAIDRWDPERRARVAGWVVLSEQARVAGRRGYAARSPASLQLEDKTRVDAFWDVAGIPRAPSMVVAAQEPALRAALRRIDLGAGAVVAADAAQGVHGGAQGLYRLRPGETAAAALGALGPGSRELRVMPFLEGVPCSIHGLVLPQGVAVLRPVEMVTLRERATGQLRYAGLGTTWDPPAADRQAMRVLARRAGEALAARFGFRGPFSMDGVLGPDGFLPTELNARYGAGLGAIAAGAPGFPLACLCLAAAEGEPLAYEPERIEAALLGAADSRRFGKGNAWLQRARTSTERFELVWRDGSYRRAGAGEPAEARVLVGPGPRGGFLVFAPDPRAMPAGALLAPRVAEAFAWADRELEAGIGPLECAATARA